MIHGPLIKYFGSKWQLAKYYPAPKHSTIIEPFAGGAGYSLQHCERDVWLFELDPSIANIWRWLISGPSEEIARLPVDLEIGLDIRTLGLRSEAADLIRRWQRVGSNTCWTVSKWGNLPGQWTAAKRDRIAEDVQQIRHWKVFNASYELAPNFEATWFIDPPYQFVPPAYGAGRNLDFLELGTYCFTRRGQVIVCEQEGAWWLPFHRLRERIAGPGGAVRKKAWEVCWTR